MAYLRCTGNSGGSLKLRTAQGEIASFETNIVDLLQEVKCEINAKQDLHGEDKPYPAGGGVNIWDEEWELGTISTSTGENLPSTTQIRSVNYIPVKPSTTYYNKGYPITIYRYDINKNFLGYSTVQVGTFTLDADTYYIRFWRTSTTYNNDISINNPSTDHDYHPYANVCPISGFTEANITRCGVNLYSDIFSEYRKPVNYYIKNIPLKVGTTYTLKAELKSGGTPQTNVAFGVANKGEQYSEFDSRIMCITIGGTTSTYTFAPTSAWTSPKLICYVSGETEFEDVFDNYEIILVEGSSATYHPYTGNTYTISFGQTVYGGVLDVTRGKLTIDTLFKTYNGSEDWRVGNAQSGNYRIILDEVLDNVVYPTSTSEDLDCICNMFVKSNAEDTYRLVNGISYQPNYGLRIYSSTYNTNDITLWKTLLANTPLQVVYKLDTPFDIDLTPVQIEALLGVNNVWHDGNGDTEVKYLYLE